MLNEKTFDGNLLSKEASLSQILKLAKQSHENYLIKDSEKELKKAIEYYLEVIRIKPSLPEAYYKLASLLWENGSIDLNYAMEQCKKAVDLDPNSSAARLHLGYFLKASGMYEEAEKELKLAIKLNPLASAKPRITLGLNLIQQAQKDTPDFREFLQGIYYFVTGAMMLLWDFGSIKVLLKSAMEDIKLANYQMSGKLHKKLKNYNAAIKVYEDAAEKTGKTEFFYSQIGDLSLDVGNPYNAVKYYRSALNTSPDNIVLWAKLANTIKTYYDGNVDELKACYSKIAELDPTNAKIYYELGHLYMKMNDHLNAVNSIKKAIRLCPGNAYYHNSLAFSLVQLKDYDGAINEYQKAIKLNPNNEWTSIVSQALGAIYHHVKENFETAIISYQTAIALDSQNMDAYVSLGELYQQEGELDDAIDCYCEAIKLDPMQDSVFCNMGMALWEKDYPEEAVISYQKAIEINPSNELAYNNLGVVYLDGLCKLDDAFFMFNKALKCNPNFALAYYNKGRACEINDQKAEAADCYQMSLDINRITNEFDPADAEEKLYNLFKV